MNSLVVLPKPPFTIFASHGPSIYCYLRSSETKELALKEVITPGASEVRPTFRLAFPPLCTVQVIDPVPLVCMSDISSSVFSVGRLHQPNENAKRGRIESIGRCVRLWTHLPLGPREYVSSTYKAAVRPNMYALLSWFKACEPSHIGFQASPLPLPLLTRRVSPSFPCGSND